MQHKDSMPSKSVLILGQDYDDYEQDIKKSRHDEDCVLKVNKSMKQFITKSSEIPWLKY